MDVEVEELMQEIGLLNACDYIIAEGKKDRASLEAVGISNIITLTKPIFAVCDDIPAGKSVAILTDLDPEGKKLYSKIKEGLVRRGVRIDDRFREFLFRHTDLRHIEGLSTYLANSLSSSRAHMRRG
jgi:5S rRNA maturation endonuclease (ribonuclease M5)